MNKQTNENHPHSVWLDYIDHEGKRAWQHVVPSTNCIFWGHTYYYPEQQWLVIAYDIDMGRWREFAMCDIKEWCTNEPM